MKTYVFIFISGTNESSFPQRLRDCLKSLPESVSENVPSKEKTENYPYWTWFLPNPLPPPGNSARDRLS
jgi:hypothetical protein